MIPNPVAAAGQEPLARGGEMAGKDIRLADSSVAKEPVSGLCVGPVLACPGSPCTRLGRQLLQQLTKTLAVTDILKSAARCFTINPTAAAVLNRPDC